MIVTVVLTLGVSSISSGIGERYKPAGAFSGAPT
jgi:hypothetical protein